MFLIEIMLHENSVKRNSELRRHVSKAFVLVAILNPETEIETTPYWTEVVTSRVLSVYWPLNRQTP